MRDDLGVGLGDERVPFTLELMLQLEIVLDDPVVDDNDAPRAVAMRVGVLFGRPSVRRPAGVADAVVAIERVAGDGLLEPRELAGAAPQFDGALADDGDARRIVSAIFEPAQPVDENRHDLPLPDVPDDAAHFVFLCRDLGLGTRA